MVRGAVFGIMYYSGVDFNFIKEGLDSYIKSFNGLRFISKHAFWNKPELFFSQS